jgi:hypothetical protein
MASSSDALRRAIAASAIGNATELVDYGVYAYAAVYIGETFFPGADPAASTLDSLVVFAVSFLVRPVGGLVWGPAGDRIGRQRVLATTILLMHSTGSQPVPDHPHRRPPDTGLLPDGRMRRGRGGPGVRSGDPWIVHPRPRHPRHGRHTSNSLASGVARS